MNMSFPMQIIRFIRYVVPLILAAFLATSAGATTIFTSSGLSGAGVPVTFKAEMTISGDTLTLVLANDSPGPSLNPADTLGSFYWDIVNGSNVRPTLTYVSGNGDVHLGDKNNPDSLQTAGANLKAVNVGDNTWQFKAMNPSTTPFAGFGIGTVGNSTVAPNNFSGNIVGAIEYSIYKGDVSTSNLDGKLLVKDTATFTFTGLTGFSEADIKPANAFGLGTAPDSFLVVPEPTGALLLASAVVSFRRRRRTMKN
jgi:hypothetical protein